VKIIRPDANKVLELHVPPSTTAQVIKIHCRRKAKPLRISPDRLGPALMGIECADEVRIDHVDVVAPAAPAAPPPPVVPAPDRSAINTDVKNGEG